MNELWYMRRKIYVVSRCVVTDGVLMFCGRVIRFLSQIQKNVIFFTSYLIYI